MKKETLIYMLLYPLPLILCLVVFSFPVLYTYFLYVILGLVVIGLGTVAFTTKFYNKLADMGDSEFKDKMETFGPMKEKFDGYIEKGQENSYESLNKMTITSIVTATIDLASYYFLLVNYPAIAPIYLMIFAFRMFYIFIAPSFLTSTNKVYKRYKVLKQGV